MNIRLACERDIDAMHRIRMAVRENRLADPARVGIQHYLVFLRGAGRGWVAESGGRLAGFAIADRVRSGIWALFVDPAFEGRGIGRQLHDVMLDWLFSSGTERIGLDTDPGTRAESFYRAAGWRFIRRKPDGELHFEYSRQRWVTRDSGSPET